MSRTRIFSHILHPWAFCPTPRRAKALRWPWWLGLTAGKLWLLNFNYIHTLEIVTGPSEIRFFVTLFALELHPIVTYWKFRADVHCIGENMI